MSFEREFARQRAIAEGRIRTGRGCAAPTEGCEVPLAVRPVNPAAIPDTLTPRNWWVVSSLTPTGTARTDVQTAGLGSMPQFFMFEVPDGYGLWSMFVRFTGVDGLVQLGDNHPPFVVGLGTVFNLGKYEFPIPLCGPLKVYIQGGVIPGDPAIPVPVQFMGLIAEV